MKAICMYLCCQCKKVLAQDGLTIRKINKAPVEGRCMICGEAGWHTVFSIETERRKRGQRLVQKVPPDGDQALPQAEMEET